MKIFLTTTILTTLFLLSGCSVNKGTGTLVTQDFIDDIKSNSSTYYIFREDAFGGKLANVNVICNDELFEVASGEFVKCESLEAVNYIGVDVDEGSVKMGLAGAIDSYSNNFLKQESNKLFKNDESGGQFVLVSTSPASDYSGYSLGNVISEKQALDMISDGYKVVENAIETTSIFRYTEILNPFSGVVLKDFWSLIPTYESAELPQMTSKNETFSDLNNKKGVVVYADGDLPYAAGIWSKSGYHGSIKGKSFIFIETLNNQDDFYTYSRGKLNKITLDSNDNGISYLKLDFEGFLINRLFTKSSYEEFEKKQTELQYMFLNKGIKKEPSLAQIELEGLKILEELESIQ